MLTTPRTPSRLITSTRIYFASTANKSPAGRGRLEVALPCGQHYGTLATTKAVLVAAAGRVEQTRHEACVAELSTVLISSVPTGRQLNMDRD
ncbi:hypothetical protein GN244_ATG18129 [Phytophthora infestans]|uniref:Uncharacterized protein n=1 Tax=Phytophthora infestans TaxID=4787 RepID=A0A833SR97_PHYIN|nr:hypothetical protein GN244_ATG18129 [Phytophthora infestans]